MSEMRFSFRDNTVTDAMRAYSTDKIIVRGWRVVSETPETTTVYADLLVSDIEELPAPDFVTGFTLSVGSRAVIAARGYVYRLDGSGEWRNQSGGMTAAGDLYRLGIKANVLPIPESLTLQDEERTSAEVNEDGTITVNVLSALPGSRTIYYFVTISEGDYIFSCGAESGTAQTNKYDCFISDTSTSPATTLIRDNSADPGNSAHIPAGTHRVTIRMRTGADVGEYTFKPMLCRGI